jgi:hypothetical protein
LSAAFLFAFFGFLRIGEITETGNASDNHVIKISDIKFEGRLLIALQHTYFRIYFSVILK